MRVRYAIHFEKEHYIVAEDIRIDEKHFLYVLSNKRIISVVNNWTYITAYDEEKWYSVVWMDSPEDHINCITIPFDLKSKLIKDLSECEFGENDSNI
jgi:hypothetical protein